MKHWLISALLCLLAVTAQAGQWCSTMSCPACPRHGLGSGTGHECFSSQSACETAVANAKRAQGSGATYTPCREEGASGSSVASSTGDPAQDLLTQGTSNLVEGMMSGNADSFAIGAMGVAGGLFLEGMKTDPAAEARRRQAAAEAAARQAEYERQLAIEAEMRNQQLMSEMLGDAADNTFSTSDTPADSTGLGLLSDDMPVVVDNNRGIMPASNTRPAIRTHGNAVLKQPEPVDALASQMLSDEPPPVEPAKPKKVVSSGAELSAFKKGFDQGINCYSSSAFSHCASEQDATIYQRCVGNYNAGYQKGESQKQTLLMQARQMGALDKQQGNPRNSFNEPGAQGDCRVEWIKAYNTGYQGSP